MKHPKVVPSNPTSYPSREKPWRPTFSLREHFHRSLDLMVQSLEGCKISDISSKDGLHNPKYRGTPFFHCSKWKHKEACGVYSIWYLIPSGISFQDRGRKNIEPCLNGIHQGFSNLLEITRKILCSKPLHSYLHVAFETFDSPSVDFHQFFQLPRGNFSELPHFLTDRPAGILTKKSGDKLIWWFSAYLTPNIDKSQLGHYNWGWFWTYLYNSIYLGWWMSSLGYFGDHNWNLRCLTNNASGKCVSQLCHTSDWFETVLALLWWFMCKESSQRKISDTVVEHQEEDQKHKVKSIKPLKRIRMQSKTAM